MKLFHSNILNQSGHLIRAVLSRNIVTRRTMSNEKPVTIGTHNGIFHCDEILACFMLRQLPRYADAKIVRSRDENILKDCDIVVDVGGRYDKSKNLFDHHQKSFEHTFSSLRPEYPDYDVRLSSAGLIYTHFGEEVIREVLKSKCDLTVDNNFLRKIFEKIYQGLIQEIDGIDNGIPMFDREPAYRITSDISSRAGRYNPAWNATENTDTQSQFEKAMVIVGEEFIDRVLYYGSVWYPARAIVEEAMENRFNVHSSGQILSLSRICPWKDHLFDVEKEEGLDGIAKYVLFCSGRDDYRVICVPQEPGSFVSRKTLRKDWHGIREADLQKISGIEGVVFVHATGFIGGCKTMEGAMQMAVKSLEADE